MPVVQPHHGVRAELREGAALLQSVNKRVGRADAQAPDFPILETRADVLPMKLLRVHRLALLLQPPRVHVRLLLRGEEVRRLGVVRQEEEGRNPQNEGGDASIDDSALFLSLSRTIAYSIIRIHRHLVRECQLRRQRA